MSTICLHIGNFEIRVMMKLTRKLQIVDGKVMLMRYVERKKLLLTSIFFSEFMIYESYYLEEDETTLAYRKAPIRIAKDDFVIPLSLRLKNEGHIYLCENDVTNSRCYWIMLQAWNGLASAIRRCETNYVPNMNKQWAKGDCKILRDSFVRKM